MNAGPLTWPPCSLVSLMDFWCLDTHQQGVLSTALYRARSRTAVAWRWHLFLFATTTYITPYDFIHGVAAPTVVLAVLEALIDEGVLSRREGAALEERILSAVDRDGRWCDHKSPVRRYAAPRTTEDTVCALS